MRRTSAQIYAFPQPQRVVVARPGAPFATLARNYERQLRESRQQMRTAIGGAIACAAVTMMCTIAAYAFYVSAIIAHSAVLWGFATAMLIVGGFFVHLGWNEYREYHGLLSLYRGALRHGRF